jgi:excisionase family DNA binding protein
MILEPNDRPIVFIGGIFYPNGGTLMPPTITPTAASPPAIAISDKDQREIQDLYVKIRTSDAKLVGPDGKAQVLPPSLYSFLCTLLGDLKDGYSVTILQPNVSLTTLEAAKLLGVSRTHFVKVLKDGGMPFQMVGTHRRVLARDVFAYKAKRDIGRRKALDDLALAEDRDGLYDKMLNDSQSK